jgi:hypothetical protein
MMMMRARAPRRARSTITFASLGEIGARPMEAEGITTSYFGFAAAATAMSDQPEYGDSGVRRETGRK